MKQALSIIAIVLLAALCVFQELRIQDLQSRVSFNEVKTNLNWERVARIAHEVTETDSQYLRIMNGD